MEVVAIVRGEGGGILLVVVGVWGGDGVWFVEGVRRFGKGGFRF